MNQIKVAVGNTNPLEVFIATEDLEGKTTEERVKVLGEILDRMIRHYYGNNKTKKTS